MNDDTDYRKSLIAERLTFARKSAGLSQGQVAKMLNMHRPTISEIEAGRRKVTIEELINFSEIYKVSMNWLSGNETANGNLLKSEIEIAARQLENLKKEDLDKVIDLLTTLRASKENK
jgi:transcriptional regulator with XRE-family HTH domain